MAGSDDPSDAGQPEPLRVHLPLLILTAILAWSPAGDAGVVVATASVAVRAPVVTIVAPPTVAAGEYLCFEVKVSGGIECNVLVEISGISLPVVVRPGSVAGSHIACVLIPAGVSGMKIDVSAMSPGSNVATATVGVV